MTKRLPLLLSLVVVAALAAAGGTALLISIYERKQESRNPFLRVVDLQEDTEDPAVWGANFPRHYDLYRRTVDQARTRYGGSEAVPQTPSAADPRTIVAQSRLEEDPRLKTMWAGYAFARDFREERGHAYMLEDQTFTERQEASPQPGACLHCHASIVVPYRRLGAGDLVRGFERMNPMPYAQARELVSHPIACIDCHDPQTMALRVTRPGFIEGMRAYQEFLGVRGYDVNTMATRQEMRSFVCGQCHVEYYFKGEEKRLTYPWAKGLRVDDMMAYYDEVGHRDWVHADSGAPVLKAQHPEFETWNQGIHARAGVACADCHMPFTRQGAYKISDHHVRSPLLNVQAACQPCHNVPEAELKARAEGIQDTVFRLRNQAMDALVALIADLKEANIAGREDAQVVLARDLQRKAQFRIDFVEAENSMGFHAPRESERVLGEAMNLARQGQIVLRDATYRPVVYPPARFSNAAPGQGGEKPLVGTETGAIGSRQLEDAPR